MILLCSLCDFTLCLWINSLIIWGNQFLRWSRRLKRGRSSIAEEFLPLKSICSTTKACSEPLFQAAILLECKLYYSFQLSCLVAHKILINLKCYVKIEFVVLCIACFQCDCRCIGSSTQWMVKESSNFTICGIES